MQFVRVGWLGAVAPHSIQVSLDSESNTVTVCVEHETRVDITTIPTPATATLIGDLVIEVDDSPIEGQEFLGYVNQYQQERAAQ